MQRKIVGIVVCTLFIVASVSQVPGIVNNNENVIKNQACEASEPQYSPTSWDDVDWWPMFHHDLNNTGNSSSPDAPEHPIVKWKFSTGEGVHSSPAVFNGRVYIGSDDEQFYCLNATNGQKIWNRSLPGGASTSSPAVYKGKVYQGSTFDYFYCWNATNGKLIWKYYKDYGGMGSPSVAEGKVYVGMRYGHIFCLNADNGTEIWKKNFSDDDVRSCPAVVNGRIYIGSYDNMLYCLDADNGSKIWDFNASYGVRSSPAVVDGRVYFGGSGLYCLDADTGEELWNHSGNTKCSPVVAYGKVYYHRDNGVMTCLDADNGNVTWETIIGSSYEISIPSPAIADGKVYLKVWRTGYLFCLDAETGDIIWRYDKAGSPEWTTSSPAVVNGTLYVGGDYTRKVFAFWTPPGGPPQPPTIDGPVNGTHGTEYNYTFVTKDPDGDNVSYKAYWGDGSNSGWVGPYPSGENITISHIWSAPGKYTIKAIAKDSYGWESNWSEPFNISMVNNPPITPGDPVPTDGATDVDINADLSWNCSDPEGDNLTYDVYFGTNSSAPPKVSSKQSNMTYNPDLLEFNTTYYWKIVAWDEYDAKTPGPIWNFTTKLNKPPYAPNIDGETSGKAGEKYEYTFNSIEPDGDDVTYFIDWGDNTTYWTGYYPSGKDAKVNHSWREKGNYTIRAKAIDPYDAESEWGTLEITMPNNKPFSFNLNLLSWLFERFPRMFPIIRQKLGL